MSRFLLVVPPLVGHVNPVVGVAAELTRRGHEVAWAGHGELITRLAGAARVYDCALPPATARPPDLRGAAALKFLWEDGFLPLATAMAPAVEAAIADFRPDALLVDQQAVAGGLIADRLGLPWLTSATTSAELTDPLASMPKVRDWVLDRLAGLRASIGDPASTADPRFSPHGVLAFTTAELAGEMRGVHFVGPSITDRESEKDFPWDWLDHRPTVLVTLGTANADAGARFLTECAATGVRAVVADPAGVLPSSDTVLSRPHVPQLELLPKMDAVICHGGHNTVCETLWHDLPLVVAPIRDDQPVIAEQVAEAGAGVRVRFTKATADHLRVAISTVLDPGSGMRANAARIGRSFRAAGGAAAAAGHLEALTTAGVRA
ncbi:glycosyltransferase [Amycolatopsis lurida]